MDITACTLTTGTISNRVVACAGFEIRGDNTFTNVHPTSITTNTISISIEGNINGLNTGSVLSQNTGSTYLTNSDIARYIYHNNHRANPSYVLQPITEQNDSAMGFSVNQISSRNNDMGTRQSSENSTTTLMNIKQRDGYVRVGIGILFEIIEEFHVTTTSDSSKDLHILELGLDYSNGYLIGNGCNLFEVLVLIIGYATVLATVIDLSCLIYCSQLPFWITNANHRGVSHYHGYGFGMVLISVRHEAFCGNK
jgi:hypothetical protein